MGKLIISENELRYIKNLYNGLLFEQAENDGRLRIDFGADFQQGKYDVKSLNVTEVYKKLEPLKKFFSDNEGGDIKLYIESSESNSTPPPGMKDGDLSKYRLQTIKSVVEGWLNKSIPDWKNNATIEEYIVKPEERQEKYTRGVDKATDPKYLEDQYVYMEVGVDKTLKPLQSKTPTLPKKGYGYIKPGTQIDPFGKDEITLECNEFYLTKGDGVKAGPEQKFIGFDRTISIGEGSGSLDLTLDPLSIPDRFVVYNAANNQPILDTQWMGFINNRHIYELKKLKDKYKDVPAFNVLDFTGLKGKGEYKVVNVNRPKSDGALGGGFTRDVGYEYDNPQVVKGLRRTKGEPQTFKIQKTNDLTKLRIIVYSPLEETMFKVKISCLSNEPEAVANN
jgi:hypothetical protein